MSVMGEVGKLGGGKNLVGLVLSYTLLSSAIAGLQGNKNTREDLAVT